ncbi:MAG: hypothetical protein RR415_12940 [Ruthenibacterium sp.]
MGSHDIWRAWGAKVLLEYLSSATGVQHDAAVYDMKYEFDIHNPDAVRFVAAVAMTKASDGEVFSAPTPTDGSVISYDLKPKNKRMQAAYAARKRRERTADGVYIPESEDYCEAVDMALNYRRVQFGDMTEEEKRRHNAELKQAEKSDKIYMFLHLYLPLGFAALTLLYIIYKLRS